MKNKCILLTIFTIVLSFTGTVFADEFDDFLNRVSGGGELAVGVNTPIAQAPDGKEFEYGAIPTFRVGLAGEYHFNDCTDLQVKALYHYAGPSYTDSDNKIKSDFITVDVPVLFKYTLTGTGSRTTSGVENKNSCGRLAVFAGPNFSFVLSDSHDDKNDRNHYSSNKSEDEKTKTGDLHAIGFELGMEYSFARVKGLRVGCSVLFDFVNFHDGAEFNTRRACIMPSIGYWL